MFPDTVSTSIVPFSIPFCSFPSFHFYSFLLFLHLEKGLFSSKPPCLLNHSQLILQLLWLTIPFCTSSMNRQEYVASLKLGKNNAKEGREQKRCMWFALLWRFWHCLRAQQAPSQGVEAISCMLVKPQKVGWKEMKAEFFGQATLPFPVIFTSVGWQTFGRSHFRQA